MAYNIIKQYNSNQIAVFQSGLTQQSAKICKKLVTSIDNVKIVTDNRLMELSKNNNIIR